MTVPIVDAHLDLAYNVVVSGRNLDLTAAEVRAAEERSTELCTVTLPELRRGGVALVFGTLYAGASGWDDETGDPVYSAPASQQARAQLEVYLGWERTGRARIVRSRADLDAHLEAWSSDGLTGIVILMEGADPIDSPAALDEWVDAGLRVVGPSWSRTRYAGGTGRPHGLTPIGRELVARMAESGVILDASHLAEEAFWDAVDVGAHRLIASHSNARALVDTDRQLSDAMISAIAERDGVIGLNLYNHFLKAAWDPESRLPQVTLADVKAHAEHIAGVAGWRHLGIGTDLDGGLGRDESPAELDTIADLALLGSIAPPAEQAGFLGGNWLRLLRESLP